jgi:hypothetical protein
MAGSGGLHAALGLPAPDHPAADHHHRRRDANRPSPTPATISLQIDIDNAFNARRNWRNATSPPYQRSAGIRAQFDLASAARARDVDRLGVMPAARAW